MTQAEARAAAAGDQVEVPVALEELAELLGSGRYERDRGLYRGKHWRADRGQGCWHLRLHRGQAWLHVDRWDPRRYPGRHTLETPELAVAVPSALSVALVSAVGLARRLGWV